MKVYYASPILKTIIVKAEWDLNTRRLDSIGKTHEQLNPK
jgi:hypothetical protein